MTNQKSKFKYINIYSNFLKNKLNPQKKLKIIFDCSNGTAGIIIRQLTTDNQQLTTHIINEKPDGNFPAHGPNPLKKNALRDLRFTVINQEADLGVIFDADGDRVFFIDNFGRLIDPDVITRILIWHLKPKKVVIDVRTGWLIKKIKNQKSKIKIYESRVGHFFIKKLMRKINADFGAEKAGHYYFQIRDSKLRIHPNAPNKSKKNNNNLLYFDSGILAAIEVINAMSKLPYSLANFNDLLPQSYRSGEINIKIPDTKLQIDTNASKKYSWHSNVFAFFSSRLEQIYKNQATKISHLDGLTIETKDWWFNLRPSNTEPVIRLNIESTNQQTIENLKKEIVKLIK